MASNERNKLDISDQKRMQLKEKLKEEKARHEDIIIKLQKEFVKKCNVEEEFHFTKIKSMQNELEKNGSEVLKVLSGKKANASNLNQDELRKMAENNPDILKQAMQNRYSK